MVSWPLNRCSSLYHFLHLRLCKVLLQRIHKSAAVITTFFGRIVRVTCIDAVCNYRCRNVAWSVRLCVGHTSELCKNGGTDQDAIWRAGSCGRKYHVLDRVKIVQIHTGWQDGNEASCQITLDTWTQIHTHTHTDHAMHDICSNRLHFCTVCSLIIKIYTMKLCLTLVVSLKMPLHHKTI